MVLKRWPTSIATISKGYSVVGKVGCREAPVGNSVWDPAGMVFISFTAAGEVLCLGFLTKTKLLRHQWFSYSCTSVLAIAEVFAHEECLCFLCCPSRTANLKWPKRYSMPHNAVLPPLNKVPISWMSKICRVCKHELQLTWNKKKSSCG